MQAHVPLNGNFTKTGNYVWGGALTLAWKQLIHDIIKQPIKISSNDKAAKQITENFNHSLFNENMLRKDCYYVKSGFGNHTVKLINE